MCSVTVGNWNQLGMVRTALIIFSEVGFSRKILNSNDIFYM
jgi:hypothetical protein